MRGWQGGRGRSSWALRLFGILVVFLVLSTAGCGADAAGATRRSTPSSPSTPALTTTARTPTLTSTTPTPVGPGPITIAFAGDTHFEDQLRPRLAEPATALAPIASKLSAADITVVNLETSIGTSGTPEAKRYTFQAPPEALRALAVAGVDVVTMANNHGLDYGPEGLADTLDSAAQMADADPPLSVVGIGANADEAFAPALRNVRGTTVAVLGASSADDDPTADPTAHWAAKDHRGGVAMALDPERLVKAIRAARGSADVVAVYVHWGVQGQRCPSRDQRDLARTLADAGADIVVGTHAHRLQGAGLLGDTYVAYGLGNFVWYTRNSTAASTTGLLTLTVEERKVIDASWAPARVRSDGLPQFSDSLATERMDAAFTKLRDCTNLDTLEP